MDAAQPAVGMGLSKATEAHIMPQCGQDTEGGFQDLIFALLVCACPWPHSSFPSLHSCPSESDLFILPHFILRVCNLVLLLQWLKDKLLL